MSEALSERALSTACRIVEDFALVNGARSKSERRDSTRVWLDYLGLEEERFNQFTDWLDTFLGPGWDGDVMIGFAVGVLADQSNHGDL